MAEYGDLKALVPVNIPFVEERYAPGQTVPFSSYVEAYDNIAPRVVGQPHPNDEGASPLPTAAEVVAEMIEWGSLSEDMNAPIHPDNVIPDPNALSLTSLQAQAEALIAELKEAGASIPRELSALVSMDDKKVAAAEEALVDERIA